MYLKPIRWSASKSMYSSDVVDIGLTSTNNFSSTDYEDSDNLYEFEYDITKNGVTIDSYSLPNGKYSIKYYVKDLLGNVNESPPTGAATEHVIYIPTSDIPAPVFTGSMTSSTIKTEMVDFKWTVTSSK
jgi:hypothetical protein